MIDPSPPAVPHRFDCHMLELQTAPWRVRLVQAARTLLKATIWSPLTVTLDRLGLGLHSIQVLCVDRAADQGRGRVLILMTGEVAGGCCPIQGLRKSQRLLQPWLRPDPDARADAREELFEEATTNPPALERFRLVHRYREGLWLGRHWGQFACTVYVIDCQVDEFPLREVTGEGLPCWARIEDAVQLLKNPALTPILRGEPVPLGDFARPGRAMSRQAARPAPGKLESA